MLYTEIPKYRNTKIPKYQNTEMPDMYQLVNTTVIASTIYVLFTIINMDEDTLTFILIATTPITIALLGFFAYITYKAYYLYKKGCMCCVCGTNNNNNNNANKRLEKQQQEKQKVKEQYEMFMKAKKVNSNI